MRVIRILVAILLALAFFIFFVRSCKPESVDNGSDTEESSSADEQRYIDITVMFSGEYGEITYLPGGHKFAFLNATEPFCAINNDGLEICGEKGEDPDIGSSPANKKLKFKSQNGKNGTLIIRYWIKK